MRSSRLQPELDPAVVRESRVYDALAGGTTNLNSDRLAARRLTDLSPLAATVVRENRAWVRRAVAHFAREGITQILDLGAGMPARPMVHQVAHALDPGCRVLYVDNDPYVVASVRQHVRGDSRLAVLEADVRDTDQLIGEIDKSLLNRDSPIGLLLVWVLPFLDGDPADLLARYYDALAPGSLLAMTHGSLDGVGEDDHIAALLDVAEDMGIRMRLPPRRVIEAMLPGPALHPGLVPVATSRPPTALYPCYAAMVRR